MGTNYYTLADAEVSLQYPGGVSEELHIGKNSYGWQFSFRAHEDLGIVSRDKWFEFLKGRVIYDEYGDEISLDRFVKLVLSKQSDENKNHRIECLKSDDFWTKHHALGNTYLDPLGYSFTKSEFS